MLPLNTSPEVSGFSSGSRPETKRLACTGANNVELDRDIDVLICFAFATGLNHLPLTVPPSFWAAFFMHGCIYVAERMDARERRYAREYSRQ